jgi:DGQHR domain-containing protein
MMADYHVIEFEQLLDGKPYPLLVGVMSAQDLLNRYKIPTIDTITGEGYQRPTWPSRVRSISTYILKKGGLLPTAILVNIRNGAAVYTANGDGTGTLSIPESTPLWVEDGQHRIKGMEEAVQRKHPLPYTLPVVFTLGHTVEQEMRLFYVVNHEQRGVPADVTADILRKTVMARADRGQTISAADLRKAVGAEVVHRLAREPGPWQNKIQMADEVKQYQKPIRFATLASSLTPFLNSDWAAGRVVSRDSVALANVANAYWRGVEILMPEAMADPESYSVQGPTGVWVFNTLLRDVARRADRASDWSTGFMAEQLKDLQHWIESPTWHRKTGDPLAMLRGQAVARQILEQVAPLLADTPGLDLELAT